jgi:hypothetical protein
MISDIAHASEEVATLKSSDEGGRSSRRAYREGQHVHLVESREAPKVLLLVPDQLQVNPLHRIW